MDERPSPETPAPTDSAGLILIAAVFFAAASGLVYELVAGAVSSYLLGDSVTQFSLVIGVFLTAMGLGSYLSRFLRGNLLAWFVGVELLAGLIGGFTGLLAFAAYAATDHVAGILLLVISVVGTLVGLEIPLVIRILKSSVSLPMNLANVLSADYVGALAASLLFPFVLLPHLGLVRAGLLAGLLNVAVGLLVLRRFRVAIGRPARALTAGAVAAAVLLSASAVASGQMVSYLENQLYQDEVILARDSAYQRIVITRWRGDVRLFLNGHLQFASVDEYRYHEALVHPAMTFAESRRSVLILGGGDGLAAQRVLQYPDLERIDLVDLDPDVTSLFRDREQLAALNGHALSDPRVHIHNVDAMRYLETSESVYDVIIADLPDPSEPALGKLYSKSFYDLAGRRLAAGGVFVTQATSPFRSRAAFWCIAETIGAASAGTGPAARPLRAFPYHTYVPTFGTWGFVLAAPRKLDPTELQLRVPTRYLTDSSVADLFDLPADLGPVPVPVSHLDDPAVFRLYRDGYHQYLE